MDRSRAGATARLRAVLASPSADELVGFLDDPSPGVARAAIKRLAEVDGAGAATELRARLLTADLSLVADLAVALRGIGDRRAVEIAIDGLREDHYVRRLAAARALAGLREPRAAAALVGALRDEIAGVRAAALDALAALGVHGDSAEHCATLLSDPNAHVRIAAIRAVARTAPRPGIILGRAAGDRDRLVRLEVARQLAGLPGREADALLADRDLRVREAAALAAGVAQVDRLAVLLVDDPAGDVRRAAADTLGRLGDQGVADVLVPGVEDSDAVVRVAVVRALTRLLSRAGAIERLRRELLSARPERRRAALYALARVQAHESHESVAALAADPDPSVRLALLHAVDALLPDPEPLVRRLTTDPDPTVRDGAEMWLLRSD